MSSRRLEIKPAEWEARLSEVDVSKEDLNRLVMDYLVVEGYRDAAETFARETEAVPLVTLDSIQERTEIRDSLYRGDIQDAISRINDLNPEILDKNHELFFHLQQQQLIELIRKGDIHEALLFAQQVLAPHGEEHPEHLEELERTMALLAYDLGEKKSNGGTTLSSTSTSAKSKAKKSKGALASSSSNKEDFIDVPPLLATLLHPAHRQRTAAEVNAAILKSQNHGASPKLPSLVRLLAWTQGLLEKESDFPMLEVSKSIWATQSSNSF